MPKPPATDKIPAPLRWPVPTVTLPVDKRAHCSEFQYAVKAVCGLYETAANASVQIVSPGRYLTAINIHNPTNCKTVTFRWKIAEAAMLPQANPDVSLEGRPVGGRISRFQRVTLRPDEAVEIDTPNILHFLRSLGGAPFFKGFVVIESPVELDIVAVYTALPLTPAAAPALAFHTERVPYRRFTPCSDPLKIDISTGVANWKLVAAQNLNLTTMSLAMALPTPAVIIENANIISYWGPQAGARWIGLFWNPHANNPTVGTAPGYYTFEYCFDLCAEFENAKLDFGMMYDDQAQVWFNGVPVPMSAGPANNTPRRPVNSDFAFKPGRNCLTIVVENDRNNADPNPVGLNLHGVFTAERASCCSDCDCCGDITPPRTDTHN